MVQRYEGRVCPIHIHVEWEPQDLGNNVPATNQECVVPENIHTPPPTDG